MRVIDLMSGTSYDAIDATAAGPTLVDELTLVGDSLVLRHPRLGRPGREGPRLPPTAEKAPSVASPRARRDNGRRRQKASAQSVREGAWPLVSLCLRIRDRLSP